MADITISGLDIIINKLNNINNSIPAGLQAAGEVLLDAAHETIVDQGNGNWPPFKRQPKRAHELLELTGRLLASLVLNGDGNIFEVTDDTITIGSSVKEAPYQNYGAPEHKLPSRLFLFIDDVRAKAACEALVNAMMQGWNS